MNGDSRGPRNAVFLLPNAFTTAALFAGFFAILAATKGEFQQAAVAIIVAALLDACDGRVARWTGTQSAFGAEYDSLSDVISFGAAPALLAYQWSLHTMDKIGFAVAFCYCAAAAMRLARFNADVAADRRYFIGIPSPAAAIFLASFVSVMDYWKVPLSPAVAALTAAAVGAVAVTMVVGVRYYSFKDFNIKRRVPFRYIASFFIVAATLYILADTFMEALLAVSACYMLSGYVMAAWKALRRPRKIPPPE